MKPGHKERTLTADQVRLAREAYARAAHLREKARKLREEARKVDSEIRKIPSIATLARKWLVSDTSLARTAQGLMYKDIR